MSCLHHGVQALAGAGALFSFGAAGSLHCAAMCGPLAGLAAGSQGRAQVLYHGARLSAYAASGAALHALGSPWSGRGGWAWSALLLLPLLLFALRPERGPAWLGRLHHRLALPALRWPPQRRALALGLLTPLLPCGLLWAAVSAAALAPSAWIAATWMLTFAAATLPLLALSQSALVWLAARGRGAWAGRIQRLSALAAAGTLLFITLP